MVVDSSAYWCDILIHLKTVVKITHRFLTDPLGLIEDAHICNVGIFWDITQCGYLIFVLYYHSWPISTIQCSKFFKEEEKLEHLWLSFTFVCLVRLFSRMVLMLVNFMQGFQQSKSINLFHDKMVKILNLKCWMWRVEAKMLNHILANTFL